MIDEREKVHGQVPGTNVAQGWGKPGLEGVVVQTVSEIWFDIHGRAHRTKERAIEASEVTK